MQKKTSCRGNNIGMRMLCEHKAHWKHCGGVRVGVRRALRNSLHTATNTYLNIFMNR